MRSQGKVSIVFTSSLIKKRVTLDRQHYLKVKKCIPFTFLLEIGSQKKTGAI